MRRILYFLSVLIAFTVAGGYAYAQSLFGSAYCGQDGLSTLYSIDPGTGAATMIGPVGFERCGGMDFSADGNLFATCERADGSNTPVLVRIDPATGEGTEVGPTGMSGSVGDISFRNSDGVLYAYNASNNPGHKIFTVDPQTGLATLVGETGLAFAGGNGMTFDLADTLFQSQITVGPESDLNIINQSTGVATFVTQISVSNPPPDNFRFSALDAEPLTGQIFGIANTGSGGSGPLYLATLDTDSGIVTVIGQTADCMDALAFEPERQPQISNIPSLSEWGLIIMSAVLLAGSLLALKRRGQSAEV
jgi:IPTL-CTERM motif